MTKDRDSETDTIAHKARQMQEARKRRRESAWYGLGMFGLVGWSVAVPTVAGIALGIWIDRNWPGDVTWTLTL